MTAEDFSGWMSSAGLTVPVAADLFGMGQRQIVKYRSGQAPIPRPVQMLVRQFRKEPGRLNAILPALKQAG